MKSHHIVHRLLFFLSLTLFGSVNVWANNNNYYAKVTAHATPTGAGTVYAQSNNNGTEGQSSTATGVTDTSGRDVSFTFTATPTYDYDFRGWANANGENAQIESSKNPYTKNYKAATRTGENNASEYDIYAIFAEKPLFYFSGTAEVSPSDAGSASVSPPSVSVRGKKWNSSSATTSSIEFSATANSSYHFMGWSDTANGTIVNTDNPYTPTLTSRSNDSNNPTNTTLYARFQPYPTGITASPSSIVIGTGDTSSPITVSVSPAGAYENFEFESSNPAIATVNGTGMVTGVAAGTTTITISSLKDDGTTVVSTTVTVTVQAKAATPVISFVPIGDGSTATATITCATTGTIIHYKVNDGAEQTYSSAFTVNADDQVEAWATMADVTLWLDSDHVTATYAICVTDEPTISYTQWDGTATVTIKAETGATIYYTTNGSTPIISSSSGTTPVTISGLANGTVVKAFAKSSSCRASAIVSKTLIVTGTSNNVVTINDLEDHTWSYYSDASLPSQLRSLNPADVKITYYGNGTGTVQTNDNDIPSAWGADATTVKVGIDANANTFVYYKTLERTDGSTAASVEAATGRCAYTTIPNPFSVRPTYDSDNTSKYRGFYGWKIKTLSGGTIHSAATGGTSYNEGDIINAETQIYFAPTNGYDMKVEFEALWARAYVSTSAAGNNNLGVERNFYVITKSDDSNITAGNNPCTYTSIYPNGTTNGTDDATTVSVYKYGGFTANADSKIEYIILRNNTSTINANGKNFTIGRGVSGYNSGVCATNLYGLNANSTTSFRFNIASGTYTNLYFLGQLYNFTNNAVLTSIMGCDYDRAKAEGGDATYNNKLHISDDIGLGKSSSDTNGNAGNSSNKGAEIFRCTVKSGNFDLGESNYAGNVQFYMSVWGTEPRTYGKRTLIVEGGVFSDISGGMEQTTETQDVLMVDMRIKGGTVNSVVYGAAQRSGALGHRRIIVTGGLIKGWIAGGANGNSNATNSTGEMNGDTYIYVGGDAVVNSNNSENVLNRAAGGNVFGAGCGYGSNYSSGLVTGNTNVAIADNAYIERGVYGGGSYGYTTATSNIYILGGTVDGKDGGVNGTSYEASITGGVYGGACQNQGGTAKIYMTGGQVNGGIYGGSNVTGTLSGSVTMHIDGGQVGTSAQTANIHGGGYGKDTRVNQNVEITLGSSTQTTDGVTVYGDVYGGSALGNVNGTTATNTYHTYVTLNKGIINGSLYGGGLGNADNAANVYGPVQVKVYGGSVKKTNSSGSGGVYGANNVKGAPQRSVTVDIYGTDAAPAEGEYALYAVYGGGNKADYTYGNGYPMVTVHNCGNSIESVYGGGNAAAVASTDVTIYGGNVIGNVFGGGNGTDGAANVNGNAETKIYGGTILKVFGGSNSAGTISGTVSVTAQSQAETTGDTACPMHITELYGGGNEAAGKAGKITIGCTGGETEGIGDVYGGARAADVTGSIDLEITGGSIQRVFGGNNISGSISGDIKVDIDWNTEACEHNYLGYVYGAGNQADFDYNTTVNMKQGTVTHDVFGGGLEAAVAGNVEVNVTGGTVLGDLYGGGALANTNTGSGKTTQVNLVGGTVNNVYGGGLGQMANAANGINAVEALVGGDVTITLNGSTATGATNNCVVTGNIFGCNNVNGTPKGHVKVHVCKTAGNSTTQVRTASDKLDSSTESDHKYEVAAVYGGGNMAAYEPASTIDYAEVVIDGCSDTSIGYVYGGGNAASVPATSVTINGAYEIGYVFGGGNGKDRVSYDGGTTYVDNPGANVGYKADGEIPYGNGTATVNALGGKMHHVFGGSNTEGNVRESSVVYLDEGSSECDLAIDEVYGGGNEAQMDGDSQINLGCITYMKEIYGGAKSADLGGDVVLTITSGHFDRVFGGNNVSGDINGSITVNVEETGCHPVTIGELYGCGNQAPYSTPSGKTDPTVNIKSFTSIGRVFGGGLGADAIVTGNPTVNINEVVGDNATTTSSAYAGTTRTLSDGSTVTLPAHASGAIGSIGTVFGGGNAAQVVGNTNVNIGTLSTVDYVSKAEGEETPRTAITVVGANVTGNVFGGGNQAQVTGNTNVVIGK